MSPISPCTGLISHALAMQSAVQFTERKYREHATAVQLQCKKSTWQASRCSKLLSKGV